MTGELVSLRDIFDKLQGVSEAVSEVKSDTAVMREQLRAVTDHTSDHEVRLRLVEKITTEVSNHPNRVSSLERKVWAIPSAATLIAAIALAVTAWKAFH